MSEFQRKQITARDADIFQKTAKLYFFVKHVNHNELDEELSDRLSHCANVIYSLYRGYMEKGRYQLEYLDFLNEEITSWQKSNGDLFRNFMIKPDQIDEIELAEQVPLQFNDSETGERMLLMYHPQKNFCDYSIISTN